jgi:hypothetical protein
MTDEDGLVKLITSLMIRGEKPSAAEAAAETMV